VGWPHILSSLKSMLETGKPLRETTRWPVGKWARCRASLKPR
jgi:hypothetical protein